MTEVERPRFRQGESANRPIGGKIVDAPFTNALRSLAESNGYKSQRDLAKALGKTNSRMVNAWYLNTSIPLPENFGHLLILFSSNSKDSDKLEPLVDAYSKELQNGKGGSDSGQFRDYSKKFNNPISRWLEDYCREKNITFKEWLGNIGFQGHPTGSRKEFGLDFLSQILQRAPVAFGLSEQETDSLGDAVALEIQERVKNGKRFQHSSMGGALKKMQENLGYKSYNGQQAADILGVTRENVRQMRMKLGLPLLMSEESIEILKEYIENTKKRKSKLDK